MPYARREDRLAYNKRYNKAWYARNRDSQRKRAAQRKRMIRKWVRDYKSTLECVFCKENDPLCLEFHHVDPKGETSPELRKYQSISSLVNGGRSIKVIRHEMSKCMVVCSNCHRKHHRDDWGKNGPATRRRAESDLKYLLGEVPWPEGTEPNEPDETEKSESS